MIIRTARGTEKELAHIIMETGTKEIGRTKNISPALGRNPGDTELAAYNDWDQSRNETTSSRNYRMPIANSAPPQPCLKSEPSIKFVSSPHMSPLP